MSETMRLCDDFITTTLHCSNRTVHSLTRSLVHTHIFIHVKLEERACSTCGSNPARAPPGVTQSETAVRQQHTHTHSTVCVCAYTYA